MYIRNYYSITTINGIAEYNYIIFTYKYCNY